MSSDGYGERIEVAPNVVIHTVKIAVPIEIQQFHKALQKTNNKIAFSVRCSQTRDIVLIVDGGGEYTVRA